MFFGPGTRGLVGADHPRKSRAAEIPLAAGYEIRGVQIAPFFQTDTDSWRMLQQRKGETIDVPVDSESFTIQIPGRDRG